MKVKIEDEEIIIDLTSSRGLAAVNVILAPVIKKKNYTIKMFESFPKKTVMLWGKSLNPYYFNCSCKDYRALAKKYPRRDLRRMCKHLFTYLSKYQFENIDTLTKIIIEHKFWYKINNVIELEINKHSFYLGYTIDFEIFFVYIPSDLPIFYSYNCTLRQWRDNNEPFADSEVKRTFIKFIHRLNLISKK